MAIRFLNSQSIDGELTVTGNVGIGTTSPNVSLEVEGPHVSGIGMFLLDGDTHAYMTMDSATGSNSGLFFKENSNNRWLIDYESSSNFLRFYDYSGAAGVRMVIEDSTGNVGIGTTSPNSRLEVSDTFPVLRLTNESSTSTIGDVVSSIEFYNSDTSGNYPAVGSAIKSINESAFGNANALGFFTNSDSASESEHMRINSSGNVGIGTTSPNSELHIASGSPVLTLQDTASPAPTGTKIEFTDSTNNVHAEIGLTAGTSGALNIKNNYQPIEFYTGTSGTSTLAIQINDNGFVGIGITNPTATLHVNGGLRVATVTEATTYSADKFLVSDAENVKYVDAVQLASLIDPYVTGGGKFVDGTDTNDAVYTTGNVGIGTTSPDSLLHISQGVNSTATNLIIENTDTSILDTEDLAKIEFKSNDATTGGVGVAASIRTVAESDGTLYGVGFNTKAGAAETEKMRITAYGNVGIGIVTPNDKLEVVGAINAKAGFGFKLGNSTETAIGKWYSASGVNYLEGDASRSFQIGSVTNGVNVRFDNVNNRVGIGTTSPTTELNVKGDITITNANGTNPTDAGSLYFAESGTSWGSSIYGFRINLQGVNNTLNFQSASTTTVRDIITLTRDTAYVGIGTTSPSSTLSVNGVYTGEYPVGSGLNNVVMGASNAGSMTSGEENLIAGNENLTLATSISTSTVSGQYNGKSISSSTYNTFFGYANMFANTGTASYSFIAGQNNLFSSIGNAIDNVIIGRGNGYNATAAAANTTLLGRENVYNSSSISGSNIIGRRNCYTNTNSVTQNNIIGFDNMYNVSSSIVYNSVMGYQNAYNATDVDYCSLFGYQNAFNASNLDYTALFGKDNGYSSSSMIYTTMSGLENAKNVSSTIRESALFGRQNAQNGNDIQYSILSGGDNAKEADFIRYSSVFGKDNGLNADAVQYSLVSGQSNAYTTTNSVNFSTMIGFENGKLPTVALDNTILLGYRQGYSIGSEGAASYRLAIGMFQDNPLIYGEFDSALAKINGSLTVTDRTGGAATKSAFFDSTGQLIEGDPASTISFAISDETSNLTVGSGKLVFRMPYAMTITDVRASVTTPPTGSTIIVDIEQGGSSIFTTNLLSIDSGEKTSTTAATPPNITTTALNDDVEIIVNIDQVGSTVAGTGLKVYLIGTRA